MYGLFLYAVEAVFAASVVFQNRKAPIHRLSLCTPKANWEDPATITHSVFQRTGRSLEYHPVLTVFRNPVIIGELEIGTHLTDIGYQFDAVS